MTLSLLLVAILAAPSPSDVLTGAPLPDPKPAAEAHRWAGADKMLERWATDLENAAAKADPSTLARIYRLANISHLVSRSERVTRALEKVAASTKLDPLTKTHARYMNNDLLAERGKLDDIKRTNRELGLIGAAFILGPFDNSAGRGHEEAYPPETSIALDEPVPGKDRAVRWRSTEDACPYGEIELSALIEPSTDATAYVLLAIDADKETKAALRTGSSDALKVFLNGAVILDRYGERSAELDQDATPLLVPKGKSVLLLKSSWSGKTARLLVRLTAPDGAALSGVRVSGARSDLNAALAAKLPPGSPPKHSVAAVTDGIERLVAKTQGDALIEALSLRSDLTALLELFDARKLPSPPVTDLDRAIRLAPDRPMLRFFYAFRIEKADRSAAREQLEAALLSDPGHAPSRLKLSQIAGDSGRRIEARVLIEAAVKSDPTLEVARTALADHRAANKFERELALSDLEATADKDRSARLWTEIARARFDLGDRSGAITAAEQALALDYTAERSRSLIIQTAIDAKQIDRALTHVDATIALHPHLIGPRIRRARLLASNGDRSGTLRALAALDHAVHMFPDNTSLAALRTDLFLRIGDEKLALKEIDRSLAIDPKQRNVRRRRAALSGEQGELEDVFTADAASYLNAPPSDAEKAWGASLLLSRTAVRLYDDGNASRFVQTILRLHKPELRDAVRSDQIRYSPGREVVEILSAELIRPNGEVIKATRIDDQGPGGKVSGMYIDQRWKNVQFDDVEANDLIHIRYRIDSIGPNIFGGFFGDIAFTQGSLPIERLEYTALAPESRPLYPRFVSAARSEAKPSEDGRPDSLGAGTVGRAPAPEIEVKNGVQRVSWTFEAVPPVEPEPMAPPYTELTGMLSVSTYKSWDDLARWYSNLFRDALELDEAAREAGKRAVAGAKDDAEKIRRLYEYVVKSTRYVGIELGIHGWKPFKASEVHRRRYGDCKDKATLLAALLRDNGIDATIVLTRTADRGGFPSDHATMWAFNHAITYVPSADLYLDGTAEYAGSTELPWQDQGAFVLVVYPDGKNKLDSPPESTAAENLNQSSYVAQVQPDGSLKLEGEERFFGARASALRQEYEEPRTRVQQVERAISQSSPGAQVTHAEFSDLSDLSKPASYKYGAILPRYAAVDQQRILLPLTLFPHQVASAYATLTKRSHDLFLTYPWATRNVIRYQLPEGMQIEALPEGVQIDTPYVSLDQRITRVEGGFETDDTVTLKTRRVPGEAYPELRDTMLAIDRALERKVVVRR